MQPPLYANMPPPKSWAPLPAPASSNPLSSIAKPPFLLIFHTSLVGLHTWVSLSLCLSVWPLQAPLSQLCTLETPAAALANLAHSDTATSEHLIFTLNLMSTNPHTCSRGLCYNIPFSRTNSQLGQVGHLRPCCTHKSQNKS